MIALAMTVVGSRNSWTQFYEHLIRFGSERCCVPSGRKGRDAGRSRNNPFEWRLGSSGTNPNHPWEKGDHPSLFIVDETRNNPETILPSGDLSFGWEFTYVGKRDYPCLWRSWVRRERLRVGVTVMDCVPTGASAIQVNVTCDCAGAFDTNVFSKLLKVLSVNCWNFDCGTLCAWCVDSCELPKVLSAIAETFWQCTETKNCFLCCDTCCFVDAAVVNSCNEGGCILTFLATWKAANCRGKQVKNHAWSELSGALLVAKVQNLGVHWLVWMLTLWLTMVDQWDFVVGHFISCKKWAQVMWLWHEDDFSFPLKNAKHQNCTTHSQQQCGSFADWQSASNWLSNTIFACIENLGEANVGINFLKTVTVMPSGQV